MSKQYWDQKIVQIEVNGPDGFSIFIRSMGSDYEKLYRVDFNGVTRTWWLYEADDNPSLDKAIGDFPAGSLNEAIVGAIKRIGDEQDRIWKYKHTWSLP